MQVAHHTPHASDATYASYHHMQVAHHATPPVADDSVADDEMIADEDMIANADPVAVSDNYAVSDDASDDDGFPWAGGTWADDAVAAEPTTTMDGSKAANGPRQTPGDAKR